MNKDEELSPSRSTKNFLTEVTQLMVLSLLKRE